ncbi:MAG TPA: AMP-binding protein, partial [Ktedonobacteraceae bacterium]
MNTSDIFLPDWLTRCAENHPQRLAVQCENVQWSFAELDRQASRIALQLSTSGVREGSRIALLAANGLPYVASVHALTRLGAILVPLNVRLTLQELCWQLRDVNASLLVCDADYASLAREIIEAVPLIPLATLATFSQEGEIVISDLPENDVPLRTIIDLKAPQAIIYTSGTTGQPKGAIITFGMQWWNAIGSALNLGHSPDDRWLACLPLFHNGSLSILMRSVIYATSVIIHKKFDPDIINQAICEDKITIISVVAVMLQRILNNLDSKAASYPSTLRCVLLGGGPAPYPLLPVRLRIMHDDKPALPG